MAISSDYRALVEEKLATVCAVRTKKMFGGLGIYAGDVFFACADDDRLYFKVDDSNRSDFESRGMGPFIPWEGAAPMGYWELPPGILDSPEELAEWVRKAVYVAQHAAANRKPKRKKAE